MSSLALVLALAAVAFGWWTHVKVTYPWRASHRRPPTPPRHRVQLPAAHPGRHEPREHQEDHDLDDDVLEILEQLDDGR